ncbi:CcdB family protein [Aeromonas rivipollensis]|uniref:Toxin CcdB n=1 Tax=Aeromonas rivipollensis TaxID=948519 RepID=A0AAW9YE66_9GAMM|nr:CcdB family protein [Aeromonas rivipollensis]NEX74976.1 cytotoxin [Aeromonas rivipollensis]
MQFTVYSNNGNSRAYPYLLDVQSNIIGDLNSRMVIPLFPLTAFRGQPAQRLNPVITIEGERYVVMTHEMAGVRIGQLGGDVADVQGYRQQIKDAIDFLIDGI